ncbi:MAG TPA: M14 family metallopeptidase [Solirubrobacteraceae bacterium]|nr:M14 family metallopeptidase [Solirubrobacteraceae bacterium]
MRRFTTLALALAATALSATTASASPVATNDAQYSALGRIFPDPLAGCVSGGPAPCSPNAQGNVPATQFIQVDEFVEAIRFMNSKDQWRRYLEVWPLDGRMGENGGDAPPAATPAEAFPGNNLPAFEFTPNAEYKSVGLPTTSRDRQRSDLYVLRVTDENVPDDRKLRYAVSLSIHGIERAGVEGGTRAAEDLVTAATTGLADKQIVPDGTIAGAPTFADVLKRMVIYFVYPNPDGWRRGSVTTGGAFFQRYNGNGVDLNRDWPDVGFSFRPYSTGSEPETRAVGKALQEIDGRTIDAGVDLHGMLTADALSYTLLGHGRHDWAKDTRIRETARNIHVVSEKALAWSPLIVPNDTPRSELGCADVNVLVSSACAQIYGQTWGTVYDTIAYTTTGTLGDWLDSPFGLGADGIDNEMAFSHLDRNIVFDPQGEQLHVDGNKGLIYAQVTSMLNPPNQEYTAPGLKGYVANARRTRAEQALQPAPPAGTVAQAKIDGRNGTPGSDGIAFPFAVKLGRQPADGSPDAGKDVYNGGLRVDVTKLNAQGVSDGNAQTVLKVQCKGCDDHPGVPVERGDWVTVAEDYNQSPLYAQAGLTVAVNRPQAHARDGKPVEWRALLQSDVPTLLDAGATMDVTFFQGPATESRDTTGFNPPRLAGYDVANTDLFEDLNRNILDPSRRFRRIDPAAVAAGRESLGGYTSIVLADLVPRSDGFLDALQGWVRDGGNLVLTDSAARMLPEYLDVAPKAIAARSQYVGQVSFMLEDGQDGADAIKDRPLLTSPFTIAQQGARFNLQLRRQLYEPTPLGFAIQHAEDTDEASVGDDAFESPAWDVDRKAVEKAGASTVATAVQESADGISVDLTRASIAQAAVGKGRVTFIGALAPQPSTEFDHDFGIEPYSLTYTGHLLLRNALEWPARPIGGGGGSEGGGGPVACTASARGFRSVSVRGAGRRRLRIGFVRRVRQPITVDVFQTSRGRRVLQERLVARFRGRHASLVWNDRRARRGRRVTDGYYFVRLRMNLGGGRADYRRVTLRRHRGRWYRRPPHYRKESCSLLTSYKLLRPVFGGSNGRAVAASYRLTRRARASLTIMRGKRVVRRGRMRVRRADVTYRAKLSARGLPRGDYRFVLRVQPLGGGRTVRAVLTSRRL